MQTATLVRESGTSLMLWIQPTILIVEDDGDFGELLRIALEAEGYRVVVSETGVRLIPYALKNKPDIILIDIVLPWVNGFELCRALRDHPQFQKTPIFLMTEKDSLEASERGIQAGANEYFPKPVDFARLIEKVREYAPLPRG